MGTFGLVGFAATFGLLGLAVVRAATALKYAQTIRDKEYLAALALIVAINIVDLLPIRRSHPGPGFLWELCLGERRRCMPYRLNGLRWEI